MLDLSASLPFRLRFDLAQLRVPALFHGLVGALMLMAVQALEAASGPEITMSLFYLVPVLYIAWHCGTQWGVAAVLVAVTAWHLEDVALLGVPLTRGVQCVNSLLRTVLFNLVVLMLGRLKSAIRSSREASQRKSDMVSLVSHEFNGAITCIDTALYILRREASDAGVRAEMTDAIQRTTLRLKNFVSNFLNLSRIESGRLTLYPEVVDAVSLTQEHVSGCALLASEKDLGLHLHAPPHPVEVRADKSVLSLALTNLLSNAIKYTPRGGTVTVSVVPTPQGVRFEVDDTGMGLSAEEAQRITAAFYRTPRSRRHAGFGIGLRVTQQMLEAHGSSLEVRPREGPGTSFTFEV